MAVVRRMAVVWMVTVLMSNWDAVGLAGARALQFAKRAGFRKAFHMVVVAFLGASHVLFLSLIHI